MMEGVRAGCRSKTHLKASDTPPADPSAYGGLAGTAGDLSLQTNGLRLATFQRLAAAAMPGLRLDGAVDANLEAQWTGPADAKCTVKVAQGDTNSALAAGGLAGKSLSTVPDVQFSGDVNCPWERLSLLLQPYWGNSIQFYGDAAGQIAYRGPLSADVVHSNRGEASASVRFSGANIYGFQIGAGEFKVHMAKGVLRADPLEVTCNEGRLTLQPEFRMDRQPMEFRLSAGTLAQQVQLDQAACRSGLKYVVPLLAAATQSQGQFSIQLDGCRVPLGDLSHAEIAGRMIVHSATMSPGPVVRQLASLLAAAPRSFASSPIGDPVPHDGRADLSPGIGFGIPGTDGADLRLGGPGRYTEADDRDLGAAELASRQRRDRRGQEAEDADPDGRHVEVAAVGRGELRGPKPRS